MTIEEGMVMAVQIDGEKRYMKVLFADFDDETGYDDMYNVCIVGYCAQLDKLVLLRYIASPGYGSGLSPLCDDLLRWSHYDTRVQFIASKADID